MNLRALAARTIRALRLERSGCGELVCGTPTGILSEHRIERTYEECHVDTVSFETSGLVRVAGWSDPPVPPETYVSVFVNGMALSHGLSYRVYRPDVVSAGSSKSIFCGFVLEFLVPYDVPLPRAVVSVTLGGDEVLSMRSAFVIPHYRSLLATTSVLHREDIYGYGPPNREVDPVMLTLAKTLPGPVLDFGCGGGRLIAELRHSGVDARGLELDRTAIRETLTGQERAFVTLYDGVFPVPFADGSFAGVFCSEVLEHIPEYEQALHEIARVTREKAILTVPDISAIPLLFPHHVVPWHLLESTHVNFFTQQSLEPLLRRYFNSVTISRIHPVSVNGSMFFTSLVACCEKR